MPGLRWTTRGAVSLPETLQIRAAPSPGVLAAGAPVPSRAMSEEELSANIRWFSRPGPRGRPVSGLVLSGLPSDPTALVRPVEEGRSGSIRRVILHADGRALGEILSSVLARLVDQLTVAVRDPRDLPDCETIPLPVDALVPLEEAVLPRLPEIAAALVRSRPRRVVFTWPFPGSGAPPRPVSEVVAALGPALSLLSGMPFSIKGIPGCALLGILGERVREHIARSGNRWYVDSSHQLDGALLFLPDVLTFGKREICRFCVLDERCDGAAEPWLQAGLVPPLVAVRAGHEATATGVG